MKFEIIKDNESLEEFAERMEETKQETLEQAAERLNPYVLNGRTPFKEGFKEGAKWQKDQYTIEEQHIERSIGELEKEYIKGFNEGSAWQEEKSYTEEEVLDLLCARNIEFNLFEGRDKVEEWFNQFRK